ncbi:uncharacterized protein LOC135395698 [Ornithodoros turicata]|uniref:uncharacterized protein LOC135395698 n=1 Tax=Ornithodoros turicata TaxID=34597 RepID=UPI003138F191
MKPVVAFLRSQGIRLVIYLDDILLMDQSLSRLASSAHLTVNLLHSLGFIVNQAKSQLSPSKRLVFLGFEIHSTPLAVALPLEKGIAIKAELDNLLRKRLVARQLARLIGRLAATSLAVLEAPLRLRSLQSLLHGTLKRGSFETTITLTQGVREDLGWWSKVLLSHPFRRLHDHPVVQTIHSDSSLLGWGAWSQDRILGRQWSKEQVCLHINELELLAVFLGLKALVLGHSSGCILLRLDNRAAVAAINRMGSTRSPRLNRVAAQLWSWCLQRNLTVRAQHVPGNQNVLADQASRLQFDSSSWKLNIRILGEINSLWGPIQVDLFADLSNFQVPQYFSWKSDPGATGVDAFNQNPADNSSASRPTHEPSGRGSPPVRPRASIGSVEGVQRPSSHTGLSGEAAELISASWRNATKLSYSSCWRKWDSWCSARALTPFSPPLAEVLNFLAHLHFGEHLAYRTINCYRSALSQVIGPCEGYSLGEHPAVTRLLKGVFNLNPSRPRYSSTWSVEAVTSFFSSLGANQSLSLRLLTYKLAMLLALTTASRSSDLALLSLEGIRREALGWELPINGPRKTSKPSKPWPSMFIPALPQEPTLCPILC